MLLLVAALAVTPVSAVTATAPPRSAEPPFSYTEHGRALVGQGGKTLQPNAGTNLVVQTHVLRPGFRAPWHRHPDSSWVLVLRGELHVAFSCTERQVWRAGSAYFNPPVETAVNQGTEPVELVVIYPNVPASQPAGTVPFAPEPPPTRCPM